MKISQQDPAGALRLLFEDPFPVRHFLRLISRYDYTHAVPLLRLPTVLSVLTILLPERAPWYAYLANRTKRITYRLSLATLSGVQRSHVVIDLGCGLGHFLRAASDRTGNSIGIDESFTLLYFARRYVVPADTVLVCADIDEGVPLADAAADRIFANDAFMYFLPKKRIVSQIARALTPAGLAFLTHVHDRYAMHPGQGHGITLKEMSSYARACTLLYTTDSRMTAEILRHHRITYGHVDPSSPKDPSYSFLLTRQKIARYRLSLPPQEDPLDRTDLDAAEDAHLLEPSEP